MSFPFFSIAVATTLAAVALPRHAAAQTSAPATPPDTAQPAAPRPPETRPSAFKDYRPFDDPPRVSWREANDSVGNLDAQPAGAHAGHRPDSARSSTAEPASRPPERDATRMRGGTPALGTPAKPATGHSGHSGHGKP